MSTCQCLSICSSVALVCLLCSLSSGSSQSVRNGYVGDEVLLPCIYPGQLPDKVNAFWRDKDDRVVLDIINDREDKMHAKFKEKPAVKVMLETPPPAAGDAAGTSSLHPALLSTPLFVLFCLLK